MEKRKYKTIECIVYTEWPDYQNILDNIKKNYSTWAMCLHDKDVGADGAPLKPHYHVMVQLQSPHAINSNLSADLGVDLHLIQRVVEWRSAVRYLVHDNAKDKYQYNPCDIDASFDVRPFFKEEINEDDANYQLYNIALECHTVRELCRYALECGLMGHLRRNAHLYLAIVKENERFGYAEEIVHR